MRFTLAIATIGTVAQAVKLVPSIPDDVLAQASAETEGYNKYPVAGKYPSTPYKSCGDKCPVDDDAGITQLPGINDDILKAAPLEYNNHGWMHTDWEHHIDITAGTPYYDNEYPDTYGAEPYSEPYPEPYPEAYPEPYAEPYTEPYQADPYKPEPYKPEPYKPKPYGSGYNGAKKGKYSGNEKAMYGNPGYTTPEKSDENDEKTNKDEDEQ